MSTEEKPRVCTNCRFARLQDYGCSNYSVDGTMVECVEKKHPRAEFPDDSPENDFASNCESFQQGNPIYLSVDED